MGGVREGVHGRQQRGELAWEGRAAPEGGVCVAASCAPPAAAPSLLSTANLLRPFHPPTTNAVHRRLLAARPGVSWAARKGREERGAAPSVWGAAARLAAVSSAPRAARAAPRLLRPRTNSVPSSAPHAPQPHGLKISLRSLLPARCLSALAHPTCCALPTPSYTTSCVHYNPPPQETRPRSWTACPLLPTQQLASRQSLPSLNLPSRRFAACCVFLSPPAKRCPSSSRAFRCTIIINPRRAPLSYCPQLPAARPVFYASAAAPGLLRRCVGNRTLPPSSPTHCLPQLPRLLNHTRPPPSQQPAALASCSTHTLANTPPSPLCLAAAAAAPVHPPCSAVFVGLFVLTKRRRCRGRKTSNVGLLP